jgi:hypothetical protein
VEAQRLKDRIIVGLLRAALVAALIGAGGNIYWRLPYVPGAETSNVRETSLQIILRRAPEDEVVALNVPVELYSIDLAAAQNEFQSERRPGQRFEDFLKRRMNGRPPIITRLDQSGQTTILVPSGKWWIHATLSGSRDITWRLPVNIAGHSQVVELTPENAYTRTKSF